MFGMLHLTPFTLAPDQGGRSRLHPDYRLGALARPDESQCAGTGLSAFADGRIGCLSSILRGEIHFKAVLSPVWTYGRFSLETCG